MTPHSRSLVSDTDFLLFSKIRQAVIDLPDLDYGKDKEDNPVLLSCHMLAMACSRAFEVKAEHGFYLESYRHSWLRLPSGNIIDVYPVAQLGGPILFDAVNFYHSLALYKPLALRNEFNSEEFLGHVVKIEEQIQLAKV
ncbi:MAG: hypothetical protein V4690_03100 [Patescibacteria group bacterium]